MKNKKGKEIETFYEYVRFILDEKGMRINFFLEQKEINIPYTTFIKYKTRSIPIKTVVKIAKYLDIDLNILKNLKEFN